MNPVALRIKIALRKWKTKAKVDLLEINDISVPRVYVSDKKDPKKTVIIASGLHLEETSGPLLLLDSEILLPILKPYLKKGIGFYIYPVINNYGLKYRTTVPDKFLRSNEEGINYNSGWGIITSNKCREVKLVEEDIKKILRNIKVQLVLSLHEDSISIGKGYIWTNALDSNFRSSIQSKLKSTINKKLLIDMKKDTVQGGKVEGGFTIVDAQDVGSFENWLADDFKIPVVLSESPFGLSQATRKEFHIRVIEASLSSIIG